MKKTSLMVAVCCLMAAFQANAAILTQMFLDAGDGNTATHDVDEIGIIHCAGTGCGTLTTFLSNTGPHGTLRVTGSLGQFTIDATGVGGLDAIAPTLQNLNQIQAASTGAGTLTVQFTDTDYCGAGGPCFGSDFVVSASTVNDTAIAASTTDFAALVDGSNSVPAGSLIGSFSGLTGLSASDSGTFANPTGTGGSLTSGTIINFSGAGTVQANIQISSAPTTTVPEPATLGLFTLAAGLAFAKLRRKASV
jgi:hypothetical protein